MSIVYAGLLVFVLCYGYVYEILTEDALFSIARWQVKVKRKGYWVVRSQYTYHWRTHERIRKQWRAKICESWREVLEKVEERCVQSFPVYQALKIDFDSLDFNTVIVHSPTFVRPYTCQAWNCQIFQYLSVPTITKLKTWCRKFFVDIFCPVE